MREELITTIHSAMYEGRLLTQSVSAAKARRELAEKIADAVMRALAAQCGPAGEPVEWQYQDRQGEWRNFIDANHRDSTIDSGAWPIRALYTAPPSQPVPVAATLEDAAADPALTMEAARELLRDAAAGIRTLHGRASQPVALPDEWVAVMQGLTSLRNLYAVEDPSDEPPNEFDLGYEQACAEFVRQLDPIIAAAPAGAIPSESVGVPRG